MLILVIVTVGGVPAWVSGQVVSDGASADEALIPLAEVPGVPRPRTQPVRALDQQPEVFKLYEQAREFFDDELYRRCAERLEQALDLAEGNYYELAYLMGQTRYRLREFGQARTFAEIATNLRPGAADAHYLLGMLYMNQGQLTLATQQFRSATLAAPDEPNNPHVTAAWFQLGTCLEQRGWLTAAVECYARFDDAVWDTHREQRREDVIAALLEEHPNGLIDKRLGLLHRLGLKAESIEVIAEALGRQPEEPELIRMYVQALIEGEAATEALEYCRARLNTLLADTPSGETVGSLWCTPLLGLAVAAADAAGQLDEWVTELVARIEQGEDFEFAVAVTRRLSRAGHHQAAIRLWQALAAQHPDDADTAWALATARAQAGELEAALTRLSEFVRQHPEVAGVSSQRLSAWEESLGAREEAGQLVARLAAEPERDFATNFVLGMSAVDAPELAIGLFQAVLDARADFVLAHIAWGRMLLAEYRWEEAKAQAAAALEIAPHAGAAHFIMATAQAGLDENEAAAESYRLALKYSPTDTDYAYQAARHYRRTGELAAAQRYFQQAFTSDPLNAQAVENLIDSYLGGRKLGVARAQLQKAEACDLPPDALRRIRTILRFAETPLSAEHLAELKRQFDQSPDDAETGLRLAAGLYVSGQAEEGFPFVERVLALDPDDERAMVLAARMHARRLEFEPATHYLVKLAQRYPNRSDLHALLAESYLADFRLDEARATLRHMLASDPEKRFRELYRQRLLLSYVEFSEYDEALAILDNWITEEPEQASWILQKLRLLLLADRDQQAMDLALAQLAPATERFTRIYQEYQEIAERFQAAPNDPEVRATAQRVQGETELAHNDLLRQRTVFVQAGMDARRHDQVIEHVRQWQSSGPEDGRYTQWLAQALIADDRPAEALEELKSFQPASPQAEAALRGWRAQAEAAAGHTDRALAELEALLAEGPGVLEPGNRAEVWEQLIQLLVDAERYDAALECCEEWFHTDFDTSDDGIRALLLSYKCSILATADRTDEYLELAQRLLVLDPDNIGLHNDLGYMWVDTGENLEQATRMIRRAVVADPLRAAYLDSLGWAYYKAGDFSTAQLYLHRAIRLREGQDPVLYDHLADAEYRLGNPATAQSHWQQALELAAERDTPPDTDLRASIEAKLAAIERGASPQLAPTAEEQARDAD
ncbi:MAG: tetratricopeptide repeat protein [Planctomycetota bacterium]